MGPEKLILLALAPLCAIVLVLAWFYLIQRGNRSTRLTLAGLGIRIELQSLENKEDKHEIETH